MLRSLLSTKDRLVIAPDNGRAGIFLPCCQQSDLLHETENDDLEVGVLSLCKEHIACLVAAIKVPIERQEKRSDPASSSSKSGLKEPDRPNQFEEYDLGRSIYSSRAILLNAFSKLDVISESSKDPRPTVIPTTRYFS